MALTSVALLCLTLVTSSYAQDNFTETCDLNPPCKKLPTLNMPMSKYVTYSPFYEPVNPNHDDTSEGIGACLTYFKINNSTYLVFRNVRTRDGGTDLQVYIITDIKGQPGAFRLQGLYSHTGNSTTVFNASVVASGCESCSQFFLFYACYLLDSEAYVHPKDDFVYSVFTSPNPPASCLDKFERLVDNLGFSHSAGFTRASCSMPPCVTMFNNNTCVNANKVDPANAISYP